MPRAVILIDHGSRRDEANAQLDVVVALVAATAASAGRPVPVFAAHMELAGPTLAEAFDRAVAAGADEVVIHPYFLAPGRHAMSDIPRQAAEAAARHPGVRWTVTDPLGVHAKLAEVVLERVEEAATDGKIRNSQQGVLHSPIPAKYESDGRTS